ncbi:MAG: hypothetical protein MI742_05480 [Desulfobacterales bacterium]|nr:hypothetical protein [Desulfobacterales bacterium]
MSINQFMDEVISRGSEALLPQNLDDKWLEGLFIASRSFLAMAARDEEPEDGEELFSDAHSMMLLSSVTELAQALKGYTPEESDGEVDEGLFFEYLSCYALAILFEAIKRSSEFTFEPPTLENLLDRERIYSIEQETPVITEILNEVILGTSSEKSTPET